MKYEYTTYLPAGNNKFIKRSMLEVEIYGPNGSHKQLALVDSGADRSLFHIEIAKVLGIDLSQSKKSVVTGITGQSEEFLVEVEIKPKHLEPIRIPVGFIDSPYVGVLLGQEGFFDKHKIKFEKDHNIFEITSVSK
ncbi:MAG: aspartyl protease family protein [Patescibacteria group bacterium]